MQGRVPVVDAAGAPLMPCTPAKARVLMKLGKAMPRRTRTGLFYIQLTYTVAQARTQTLVLGIDPGTRWEAYSVVGRQACVVNLMVRLPERRLRRGKASRSHATRLLAFRRVLVDSLASILPIGLVAIERFPTGGMKGRGYDDMQAFLEVLGQRWPVRILSPTRIARLRQLLGLGKLQRKSTLAWESHCVDAWAAAWWVARAEPVPVRDFYYVEPALPQGEPCWLGRLASGRLVLAHEREGVWDYAHLQAVSVRDGELRRLGEVWTRVLFLPAVRGG